MMFMRHLPIGHRRSRYARSGSMTLLSEVAGVAAVILTVLGFMLLVNATGDLRPAGGRALDGGLARHDAYR